MPIAAKIVFTGLAVIVGKNVANCGDPTAVVFPNAESAAHVTYIAVPDIRYTLTSSEPDRVQEVKSPLNKKYLVARLRGEFIQLLTPIRQSELTRIDTEYDHDSPRTEQEARSLYWLPDMSRVFPKFLRTSRPAAVSFITPGAKPELVSARFEIQGGHLETSWVSGDVWRIKPRNVLRARLQQSLAQEVTLSMDVDDRELVFKATPIDDPNGTPTFFTIRPKAGVTSFTVLFGNTRLEDIAPSTAPPAQCSEPEPGYECIVKDHHPCHCADPHFRMYYRMFDNQPDVSPVPYRVKHGRHFMAEALRVGAANCGPGRYR